jgi:hypothetical protein
MIIQTLRAIWEKRGKRKLQRERISVTYSLNARVDAGALAMSGFPDSYSQAEIVSD